MSLVIVYIILLVRIKCLIALAKQHKAGDDILISGNNQCYNSNVTPKGIQLKLAGHPTVSIKTINRV